MSRIICSSIVFSMAMSGVVAAAPTSFADDFQTVTTYNHQTYIDACAGTLPDWSIQAALDGSTFYERAVRGGGKLRISNWAFDNTALAGVRLEAVFVGWAGGVLACAGEPGSGRSDTVFTHDDICIYGGYEFNRFQLTGQALPDISGGGQFGLDLKPGIAGVDDDGNGSTDDDPNCTNGLDGQPGVAGIDDDGNGRTDDPGDHHANPPGGFGCAGDDADTLSGFPAREFLSTGPDGKPGIAGVDDDGNGLTDVSDVPGVFGFDDDRDGVTDEAMEMQWDQGELGTPGSDDSDDIYGDFVIFPMMRTNFPQGSFMGMVLQIQNASAQFSVQDVVFFQLNNLEGADEIGPDFYQADTRYNYAFCATGSVYGAQLWVGNNAANPVETIGPLADVNHLNKAVDTEVGLVPTQLQNGIYTTMQNVTLTTNSTFGDMYQIVEGDIVPIVSQDRDKDGDVDGVDFAKFASCFNKAGNPPRTLGCTTADASAFDQDGDNDVDGVDFSVFASCFNKAGNPPREIGCIPDLSNPGGIIIPPNDLCVDATPVGDGQTLDKIVPNGTQDWPVAAGNCPGDGDAGSDLWYEYTPSCSGTAVTVTASTASTNTTTFPTGKLSEDTALAIFTACPPSLATLLTCVDNDTGGESGNHETTSAVIDTGLNPTVIIAVIAEDAGFGDHGSVALDTSCSP